MKRAWSNVVVFVFFVFVVGACDGAEAPDDAGAFAVGSAPNAVVVTTCDGAAVALVAASQGAALDVVDLATGALREVPLGQSATPWAVALRGDRGEDGAVVTGFGKNALFLVDPCAANVVDAVSVDTRPERVSVDGARLRHDVAGVGARGDVVNEMPLMGPEAVVVDDAGRVWVSFTNVLEVADSGGAMEAGAGVLARFTVDDSGASPRLVYDRHVELRCQNPQGLATDGVHVAVTCTGRFQLGDGGLSASSAGGLAVYDADFVEVVHREDAGKSYGTPAFFGGNIVVGDVFEGVVYAYAVTDLREVDKQDIGGPDESIFKILVVNDEVAALRFLSGDLVLDPFRTGRVVAIGDPRQPPRGLIDLAVDVTDATRAWAVFSLSAELATVTLGSAP